MSLQLLAALLSVCALASAVVCIVSDYAGRRAGVYLCKPLTMVFLLALAGFPSEVTTDTYRAAIILGLAFSLAGDVFLMLPSDRFLPGLAGFLVAHLVYVFAFGSDVSLADVSVLSLAALALPAAAVFALLRPGLGRMEIPVIFYITAIVAMAWLSIERMHEVGQLGAAFACVGALLFVISDGFLAWNRFRTPFRAAQALVLGTYFTGQWLIALSTGTGEMLVDWGIR